MVFTEDFLRRKIPDGEGYVASEKTSIGSGNSSNLHIRNPEGSNRAMWIVLINPTIKGESTFNMYDDFDSITDGTPVTLQNTNLDSENIQDSGPFEAYFDSTFTPATDSLLAGSVIGSGGSGGANSLGGAGRYPPMRVEEGRELVMQLENDSASVKDATHFVFLTE